MITTLVTFWPTQNTIIGARATIGIVWLAMTYGDERALEQPGVDEGRGQRDRR